MKSLLGRVYQLNDSVDLYEFPIILNSFLGRQANVKAQKTHM